MFKHLTGYVSVHDDLQFSNTYLNILPLFDSKSCREWDRKHGQKEACSKGPPLDWIDVMVVKTFRPGLRPGLLQEAIILFLPTLCNWNTVSKLPQHTYIVLSSFLLFLLQWHTVYHSAPAMKHKNGDVPFCLCIFFCLESKYCADLHNWHATATYGTHYILTEVSTYSWSLNCAITRHSCRKYWELCHTSDFLQMFVLSKWVLLPHSVPPSYPALIWQSVRSTTPILY